MKSISLKKIKLTSDRKTHLIKAPGMGQGGGSGAKKKQYKLFYGIGAFDLTH